jgi:hypothetical protein
LICKAILSGISKKSHSVQLLLIQWSLSFIRKDVNLESGLNTPLAKKTGLLRIRHLVHLARAELFRPRLTPAPVGIRRRVTQKGLAPEIGSLVVTKLVEAIGEVERIAKASGKRSKRGTGGVAPKVRWYQLMSNLAQVLDGVLKNIDLEGVKEQMDKLEVQMDELQRTTPQAGG